MAASERIFKLLDEPVTIVSPATAQALARIRAAKSNFAMSGSPITAARPRRKMTGFCATSPSASSPGRRSPSSATPARAKPPSFSCCCASTISSAAKSCSMASISASSICRICAGMFGIVLQDPFLFTGTLESNVKLGTPTIDREAAEARLREVGLGPFSIRCRKAWTRRSPSAAPRFPSASAN